MPTGVVAELVDLLEAAEDEDGTPGESGATGPDWT